MQHTAVIFDLFGTLVDIFSAEEYFRVLAQVAEAVGASPEAFAAAWRHGFDQRAVGAFGGVEGNIAYVAHRLGLEPPSEGLAEAARYRLALTRRNLEPRPDAVATLSALRAAGFRIGLVSDCTSEVPVLWPETPLAPLVDAAVFSSEVHLKKPDPAIYHLACERLGVTPPQCVYVGDGGSRELSGAAAVGMTPVLIRVPYENEADVHRVDGEEWGGLRVSSLSEVLALVT